MTRPLVVLRPEPGLSDTLANVRELGLTAIAAPLFAIEPLAWQAPDPADFDAIIAGSANAFRCGGRELASLTALPVHAVGKRTADAARAAGFSVAAVGEGGLQAVLDTLAAPCRLLRLAGEKRLTLRVPTGCRMTERVVYRAVPLPLESATASVLRQGAVALLHSAEAAARFAGECDRLQVERGVVRIAALGPRIAAAAEQGWQHVAWADRPTDAHLLAMAATVCQD